MAVLLRLESCRILKEGMSWDNLQFRIYLKLVAG